MNPTRAYAGIHDPRRPPGERDRQRVARALAGGGEVRTFSSGSLVLAWTGDAEPAGTPKCFLDGHVYNAHDAFLSVAWRRSETHRELANLRGDFVLLVFDEDTDAGFFARDQLGGRSLVWHHADGRLTFASEVRFLLPLLASRPDPDPGALAHWLARGGQPADRTLYAGIHRLEPAHVLTFGEAPPVAQRYWTPRYRGVRMATPDEHADGLRTVVAEAVARRCTSEAAPTGILASGGLDSGTVAALAARLDGDRRPVGAYTATFPEHPSVDESELVDLLCRTLDLNSTRAIVQGGSVLAGAIEYITQWQVPPPSPNLFFWLPLLRRAASDGVRALLDGEGGDELFGLSPYLLADRVRHGRVTSAVELVRRIPGGGRHLSNATIGRFICDYGIKGATPAAAHRAVRRWRGAETYAPPWLRAELAHALFKTDDAADWKELDGPRWWSYLVAVTTRGTGATITYDHVRRRAALAGLEARHPLVDVDVVEYVLGLPPELAFDPRHSRPLLRSAMAGLLPDDIRLRAGKSNFDAVFHEALAGPDLALARSLLAPASAALGAFVDLDVVGDRLLAAPPRPAERQGWAIALWRLLTAECWLRAQNGPLPRPPHTGQICIYSPARKAPQAAVPSAGGRR